MTSCNQLNVKELHGSLTSINTSFLNQPLGRQLVDSVSVVSLAQVFLKNETTLTTTFQTSPQKFVVDMTDMNKKSFHYLPVPQT